MSFNFINNKKKWIAIGVLVILHLVGFFGLNSPWKHYFVSLTALNLLITAVLMLAFKEASRQDLLKFFILAFSLGMIVEIVGVTSGFPFGSYHYSSKLSFSVLGVPLIIGVNWFLLSYGILATLNRYSIQLNYWVKVLTASIAMTFMDVFIEPFAIYHDLWIWENSVVPIKNYLSWFIISCFLFALGFKILKEEKNHVASMAILIMLIFFVLNNLMITMF